MAREFDELESETRRRALDDPPHPESLRGRGPLRYKGDEHPLVNPPISRIRELRPQDPSADTFDQRFRGENYNSPIRYPKERSYPVRPGHQERFLDPTKVISDAGPTGPGPISQIGKNSAEQPYPVKELPPGFSFEGGSSARELPPGFRFEGDSPEDPHERAARRTQQSVKPSGGRKEGAITQGLTKGEPVRSVYGALDETAKKAFVDPSPENVLPLATMGIGFPPGMAGAARAALPRKLTPDQAAQVETGVMSIPRAAEAGPIKQTISTHFGDTPAAAQRATAELQVAGKAAGGDTTQDIAGGYINEALRAAGDKVPPRLNLLTERAGSNEETVDWVVRLARTGSADDLAALSQLRKFVPAEQQGAVQGAVVQRLGQTQIGAEGFVPEAFVSNYSKLSDRSKNILFSGPLRHHLDSLEAVSRRAPTWQHLEQKRSPVGLVGAAGAGAAYLAGPVAGPLAVLGAVIPMAVIGRGLGKPATAASISAWARAYERVVRTNRGPQAMASFNIATRNLNNTLGTDVSPDDLLRGQNGQPVE